MLPKPLKHNLLITVVNFHQSVGFPRGLAPVKHFSVRLAQGVAKCGQSVVIVKCTANRSEIAGECLAFVKRSRWQCFAAFEMPVVQVQHPAGLTRYRANKHPIAPGVAGQVAFPVAKFHQVIESWSANIMCQ